MMALAGSYPEPPSITLITSILPAPADDVNGLGVFAPTGTGNQSAFINLTLVPVSIVYMNFHL